MSLKYLYFRKARSVLILSWLCNSCDAFHAEDVMRFLMSCHCPCGRWHHMELSDFIVDYDQVVKMYRLLLVCS